jgi:hypothetical protein
VRVTASNCERPGRLAHPFHARSSQSASDPSSSVRAHRNRVGQRRLDSGQRSADTGQLMAKKWIPDDGSGPEEVRVTIVVEPGRVRAMLSRLLARARGRAWPASGGIIAAVVAGTIIVASSSTGREPRSSGSYSPWPTDSDRLAMQNCARLTVISPDGAYARIDLDRAGPCGTSGKRVTLIVHRVDAVWVREFEASSWTCPMNQVPQPVETELQLCRSNRVATATGGSLAKIPLDH